MRYSKLEAKEARDTLLEILPPGATVYTVLRNVARSGMSRAIDCYIISEGEPRWISRLVARATGFGFDEKREAVRASGCGMDMGFHIVSTLSRVLYPEGFGCVGGNLGEPAKLCPSNDHSNGDRDYTPHGGEVKHWHGEGGYALKHRWM